MIVARKLSTPNAASRNTTAISVLAIVGPKTHEWHIHDIEDKFFYVVEGGFRIDLEDRTVELAPKQGFTVPKGMMHRTRSIAERTVMLQIGLS